MKKVLGVVVLYNFNESVIENIISYSKFCNKIIAVDNSDKNITEDLINSVKKIENLEYIKMPFNQGIAKAINVAGEIAIKNNYDWLLTMDQDSKFANNLIDIYFNTLANKDLNNIAVISPNYFFDRKNNQTYNGYKEISYAMQSANLVNIDIYKKIGSFKEEFFIDGVDYEYCLRAASNGYKIIECGEAVLYHSPAITKKFLFFKYGYCSPNRIYYQIRNLSWIYKKYKCINMKFILIYKLFKILFLFDNKIEYLKMYIKGKNDFRNNNFGKLD